MYVLIVPAVAIAVAVVLFVDADIQEKQQRIVAFLHTYRYMNLDNNTTKENNISLIHTYIHTYMHTYTYQSSQINRGDIRFITSMGNLRRRKNV